MVSIIDRHAGKSGLKRDGPVFFSSAPVKVAGDERTSIAIVASHWSETSPSVNISSGRAVLPRRPNKKTFSLPCAGKIPSAKWERRRVAVPIRSNPELRTLNIPTPIHGLKNQPDYRGFKVI
jgi:hypothetical protein